MDCEVLFECMWGFAMFFFWFFLIWQTIQITANMILLCSSIDLYLASCGGWTLQVPGISRHLAAAF